MSEVHGISLRYSAPEDQEFLFSLYASTRRDEMAALGWGVQQQDAFLRMQFNAQRLWYEQAYEGAEHSIVLIGQQCAGRWIVLRRKSEIMLVDISLLPEFQKRGLGTELLQRLILESEQASLPLRLQVARNNPARRLYERLGFVAGEEDQMYCHMERPPQVR